MVDISKFIDLSAEEKVIGGILNDPTLLGKAGEYKLLDIDFYDIQHKQIYSSLFELYLEGNLNEEKEKGVAKIKREG